MKAIGQEYFRPLCSTWREKIDVALKYRKEWADAADACYILYSGIVDAFWKTENINRFVSNGLTPKFKLSIAKAFELVALFGPTLFYRLPVRAVRPHKRVEYTDDDVLLSLGIDPRTPPQLQLQMQQLQQQMQQMQQTQPPPQPQAPGMPPAPPPFNPQLAMAQQQLQQMQMQLQQIGQQVQMTRINEQYEKNKVEVAARICESYLSYTPYEQPDGGLERHGIDACTDMLVTGRGVMFPRAYTHPGSKRTLTGCFRESSKRIVTDPDAKTTIFGDCKWLCLYHRDPHWELEKRFGLKEGSLRDVAKSESGDAASHRKNIVDGYHVPTDQTFDLVDWWEIWSIAGPGTRLKDFPRKGNGGEVDEQAFAHYLDDLVGDYAYLCVAEGVDFPLNCSKDFLEDPKTTDEEIKHRFSWPLPFHLVQKWPCAFLEAYRDLESPYPIAPLRPALAELTLLNFLMSQIAGLSWANSRQVIAVLESAKAEVEAALKGGSDIVVIGLKDIHQSLKDVISEFTPTSATEVLWRLVEALMAIIDKRTGLSEVMYGGNEGGKVSRSAADVNIKRESSQVRPDHMSKEVDSMMREIARMEKLAAYFANVTGKDVEPRLGTIGAQLWDRYFVNGDPDMILYEMDATVEPGTTRKPNKDRDIDNLSKLSQPLLAVFQADRDKTGDPDPINAYLDAVQDAYDLKTEKMHLKPPNPPQANPQQQAELQMKQAVTQANVQATQIKAQAEQQRAQANVQSVQIKAQIASQQAQQGMQHAALQQQMDMQQGASQLQQGSAGGQMDMQQQAQQHAMEMQQATVQHLQELAHAQQSHEQEMAIAKVKQAVMRKGKST